jgi:hypothetical protein
MYFFLEIVATGDNIPCIHPNTTTSKIINATDQRAIHLE